MKESIGHKVSLLDWVREGRVQHRVNGPISVRSGQVRKEVETHRGICDGNITSKRIKAREVGDRVDHASNGRKKVKGKTAHNETEG